MKALKADLCVIGAGSGGLSVAAAASQMGAKVVLLERDKMGGDCLNSGCVPSKALLAAAKHAASAREGKKYGVTCERVNINYAGVADYVQSVIAAIAPHDSIERFTSLGVKVISAAGTFRDATTVQAGDQLIAARRYVIATGSQAFVPPIPGLKNVPYFTNDTIFSLREQPRHLVIIGAGPIGCEMAQAHRMLGTEVSLIDVDCMMPRDDPDCVAVLRTQFIEQGISLFELANITRVRQQDGAILITLQHEGEHHELHASHVLVATGRRPNVADLNLEKAGIEYTPRGIQVDKRLRTSNHRCYAIGDVIGDFQFTHAAGYQAGVIIKQCLFRWPSAVNYRAMPWVTYTDPELAQVGLTERQAMAAGLSIHVEKLAFKASDRAQAEGHTSGLLKLILDKKARVLGISIVGLLAGELILPWSLMINQKIKLSQLASQIVAYPTVSELTKAIAGQYYKPLITSNIVRTVVKRLAKLP